MAMKKSISRTLAQIDVAANISVRIHEDFFNTHPCSRHLSASPRFTITKCVACEFTVNSDSHSCHYRQPLDRLAPNGAPWRSRHGTEQRPPTLRLQPLGRPTDSGCDRLIGERRFHSSNGQQLFICP